jgi:diacylglycerol kinase (ATP)
MPLKRWIEHAGYAVEGVLHAAKTQRHLRYHFYSAVLVLMFVFLLGVTRTEFLIISLAVTLVLLAEMMNTAIEATVDILSPERAEKARIAKDIAAGAVFITSFGALVMGLIILYPYLEAIFDHGFTIAKHFGPDIAIIAFVLVLITVVLLKAYLGKGRPLSGGMPSGHSALAFSVWVSVTFISGNFYVSGACFLLAVFIAGSRISKHVHHPFEVIAGGAIGALITFALFRIFL